MLDQRQLERLQQNKRRLRSLSLKERFGDATAQVLAECLPNCTHLKKIYFHYGCHVGPDRFEQILNSLQHNESVTNLRIYGDRLGDKGVKALSELLKVNKTLDSIYIWQCDVTDSQAIELAKGLKENQHLSLFGLLHNEILDDGAEAILKALESKTALRHLCLSDNRIGAHGAGIIANFIARSTSLQAVSVGGNPFGDEGNTLIAKSMEENMSLTTLFFDGNEKEKARVDLFLALNKVKGRKLLSINENDAHPCLWAHLLSKVGRGHDDSNLARVFYLLREKPGLFTFLPMVRKSLPIVQSK